MTTLPLDAEALQYIEDNGPSDIGPLTLSALCLQAHAALALRDELAKCRADLADASSRADARWTGGQDFPGVSLADWMDAVDASSPKREPEKGTP